MEIEKTKRFNLEFRTRDRRGLAIRNAMKEVAWYYLSSTKGSNTVKPMREGIATPQ